MTNKFLQRLEADNILISDGATGTNLQEEGLIAGITPETWVMEKPQKILDLEKSFVEAGSDIILTCTFGATSLRLSDGRYKSHTKEVNERAVELAKSAAAGYPEVIIAGSMGPVGGLIKPYGPLSYDEVSDSYSEQAEALYNAGVDVLVIETQFSLDEAKAAFVAANKAGDLPIVVSFSYDMGQRTMMGVKPSQVLETFLPLGVTAIGANCGKTLKDMKAIISEYAAIAPDTPIWAKPNAGLPELNELGETIFRISPSEMGEATISNINAGARIVGGCCGNTPRHISEISRRVKELSKN